MSKIDPTSVYDVISKCGFIRHPGKTSLFLVSKPQPVTPAFYCNLAKKRGKIRLGGGIGLYFREFEALWNESISNEERHLDATLPMIMLIDNYSELIKAGVFEYSDLIGVQFAARQVHNLVSQLPSSLTSFESTLIAKIMLRKPVSDYLHIFDYHSDDDLYFRKSASFVRWFIEACPQSASHMRQCLTARQLQRLGLR